MDHSYAVNSRYEIMNSGRHPVHVKVCVFNTFLILCVFNEMHVELTWYFADVTNTLLTALLTLLVSSGILLCHPKLSSAEIQFLNPVRSGQI